VTVILKVAIALGLMVAALDGYQAITGRRVSKRPSRRTDHQMRVQSAVAAIVLSAICVGGLIALNVATSN
jgi:hypothetical protein